VSISPAARMRAGQRSLDQLRGVPRSTGVVTANRADQTHRPCADPLLLVERIAGDLSSEPLAGDAVEQACQARALRSGDGLQRGLELRVEPPAVDLRLLSRSSQ
jgi:hypothetical protein